MNYQILLMKESRAGEQRVALTPQDVGELSQKGHKVFVMAQAGEGAGFSDDEYQKNGATIVSIIENNLNSLKNAFKFMNIIVRAKRPNRAQEILEAQAFQPNTFLIGALDPFEKHSNHIHEYREAGIKALSIDQLKLPHDDPMNVLSAMSKLAGKLALIDALHHSTIEKKNVVIIGFGMVGQAALQEALVRDLNVKVIISDKSIADPFKNEKVTFEVVSRIQSLKEQQDQIEALLKDADMVITSARKHGQKAPLLITKDTLKTMKSGAVIVDMAISEGGNVDGSLHDETVITDRQVVITNVSGYPKVMPREASILWSQACLQFILKLVNDPLSLQLSTL